MGVVHIHHTERKQQKGVEADGNEAGCHFPPGFNGSGHRKRASAIFPRSSPFLINVASSGGTQVNRAPDNMPLALMDAMHSFARKYMPDVPFFSPKSVSISQRNSRHAGTAFRHVSCRPGLRRTPPGSGQRFSGHPDGQRCQLNVGAVEFFQKFHISAAAYSCPHRRERCNGPPADQPVRC